MERLQEGSASFKIIAVEGLKGSLTSAIAWAQAIGAEDVCDRLLAVKRDVLMRDSVTEAAAPGLGR